MRSWTCTIRSQVSAGPGAAPGTSATSPGTDSAGRSEVRASSGRATGPSSPTERSGAPGGRGCLRSGPRPQAPGDEGEVPARGDQRAAGGQQRPGDATVGDGGHLLRGDGDGG